MVEDSYINTSLIDLNDGQIEGLGRNPRQWTYDEVVALQSSIKETPELLHMRGIIVMPYGGRFVAIGGNMRLCALKGLKVDEVPCVVLPEDTDIDTLRQITIKDNSNFGSWDEEILKTEWSESPFAEWGIDVFLDEHDKEDVRNSESDKVSKKKKVKQDEWNTFEIEMSPDEYSFVSKKLKKIGGCKEVALLELIGYTKQK